MQEANDQADAENGGKGGEEYNFGSVSEYVDDGKEESGPFM